MRVPSHDLAEELARESYAFLTAINALVSLADSLPFRREARRVLLRES